MSGAHRDTTATRTITVRWRSVAAVVPAAVLTATGIAVAQTGVPARTSRAVVPQVPQQALTQPGRTGADLAPAGTRPAGADPELAPGLALPAGTAPFSRQPVQLDQLGIPARALSAYHLAARLVSDADPACGIDWALVGAIGRVESDHARFGSNALDAAGVARPGIIGIPLDGRRGTARIGDTDRGRWDRDTVYDRAVGPMQFIPGTWRVVGSDANGDGARDPQNIDDAATATAVYLCSGPGDLRRGTDLYNAIRRYNNSDSYVRTVVAIADAYRHGVTALPASSLPAAHAASSSGGWDPVQAAAATVKGNGSGARTEAAGASRTSTARSGGSGGSSGSSGSGDAAQGSDVGQPAPGPTSASVPAAGGVVAGASSAASSAVSSVVSPVTSVVTSLVTKLVPLPTPIVTTTTPCVVDVLGVKVCTITTITATPTTSTVTKTVTKAP
ncbi:MAG: lytic transglycosylase domain-containing protein [Angustibacter sp.]